MIIREAIDRVQHDYSKGIQSDDSRLNNRFIYSNLLSMRNQIFIEQTNKHESLGQWAYNTIQCVELVKSSVYDCPCIPSIDCGMWKTKHPLPESIVGRNKHLIKSVTRLDGLVVYDETTFSRRKNRSGNKYTSSKQEFFIYDDYLFIEIPNSDEQKDKVVAITMAAYDPIQAELYSGLCSNNECLNYFDVNIRFGKKADTIIEMTSTKILNKFLQILDDKRNNSIDERT